ncbi:hypothetical protein MAR_011623, partial [Mya arenaria]
MKNTRMEPNKICFIVQCFLCAHLFVFCVLINGEQVINVTNDTCGQHIFLQPDYNLQFHYDGSPIFNPDGSITKCEFKIINSLENTELCVSSYGELKHQIWWERLCTSRFRFRYQRYSSVMCHRFTYFKECRKADVAYAEFKHASTYKNNDFDVVVFAEYKGIMSIVFAICFCVCKVSRNENTPSDQRTQNTLGRNTEVGGLSHEPLQVDASAFPRSDSPPPYGSLIFDGVDKHRTAQRDPSLPPYISDKDFITKCPSSRPLIADLPQEGACDVPPNLPQAPPQSEIPSHSGSSSVPYQATGSESRQTDGTSRHSTSSNNETTPNPPQPPIELSERPPPPSYEA